MVHQPINVQGSQKWPHNFNDIWQAKAKSYLMEKCQSDIYLQLSFKIFVKPLSISKLFSKVL